MIRSRSSFLKWLLVGPIITIPAGLFLWLSLSMDGGQGMLVYSASVVSFVVGLMWTCVGWFDKLGFHKHLMNWMEK